MTDQYVGEGNQITITAATGGTTEGGIYRGTSRAGVYLDSVTGGASVAVALEGVFTITKPTALDVAAFEDLYVVTGGTLVSTVTAAAVPIGMSTAIAATGITSVTVKLGSGNK